jgi:hypothetical protein
MIKKSLIALSLLLVVSAAVAKPPTFNQNMVLQIRKGPSTFKIKDSSGNRNNGVPTAITVSNSPSLVSMQDTHQLTLVLWIKPNSIPSEFPDLISKGGNQQPGAYGGYELTVDANGDHDIDFASGAYYAYTPANGSLVNNHLGEWIHVAFTIDTVAQTAQFYVNGEAVTTATSGSTSDVNFNVSNNLYIGTPDPAANNNRSAFDGDMAQIMIFNRALSPEEIHKIFSSTKPASAILLGK